MTAIPEGRRALPRRGARRAGAPLGVVGALLLGIAALLLPMAAQARPPARFADPVIIDVTPLLAKGLDGYAEALRADLRQALEAQFAGRLGPGQRLVVVVRSISLASYVGDVSVMSDDNDFLDGVVTLFAANGQPLATQKILVQSPSSAGGPWYVEGGELRRAAILARVFASWAARYIPG